jgi:glycine/D-amino acid oxidase-like deaminating enzyme
MVAVTQDGSLWARKAPPPPDTWRLEGERRADVCIVGGGFLGMSTALHLAEAGTSVAVLEAGEIGEGGSGRNGGQVIPGIKKNHKQLTEKFGGDWADKLVALGDGAAHRVYGLIEKHGIQCDLQRNGWLRAAHAEPALRDVEAMAAELQGRGQDVEVLSRDEFARRSGTSVYVGGMHDKRAAGINPLAYVRGLAAAAIRSGATVHTDSPAESITKSGKAWRVSTPSGTVVAEQIVLATGAYTDALWPGLAKSFIGVQSAQIASKPLSENLRASIMPAKAVLSDTRKLANYYRVDAEGRLIMGGRGPLGDDPEPSTLVALERAARERFPMLADVEWEHAWAGRIDMTLDQMPHLCVLAPGVTSFLGLNGRGIALTTTFGAVLANRLTGGRDVALHWPESKLATVPFHALRAPGLRVAVAWYRLRDALGYAG